MVNISPLLFPDETRLCQRPRKLGLKDFICMGKEVLFYSQIFKINSLQDVVKIQDSSMETATKVTANVHEVV